MANVNESLQLVTNLLAKFYQDEPDDTAAALHTIQAGADNVRNYWRLSRAFREVLSASLLEGTLQNLVAKVARRDVWNDNEAREFLQKVYDDTYLDDVAGFDEEDEEDEEDENR